MPNYRGAGGPGTTLLHSATAGRLREEGTEFWRPLLKALKTFCEQPKVLTQVCAALLALREALTTAGLYLELEGQVPPCSTVSHTRASQHAHLSSWLGWTHALGRHVSKPMSKVLSPQWPVDAMLKIACCLCRGRRDRCQVEPSPGST